jgi:hypothetical protein
MLVAVVTWCGEARAETVVDQVDVSGQVWTPEGSPYLIRTGAGLTVTAGRELRVEGGTEVLFPANGGRLNLAGSLTLAGTLESPVILRGEAGGTDIAWDGIVMEPSGNVTISGAIIRNALAGVQLRGGAAPAIVRTTFEDCSTGMMLMEGTYTFDSIVMRHNGTGVSAEAVTLTLTNALIQDNNQGVLAAISSSVTVVNSTIHGNRVGFLGSPSIPARSIEIQNAILSNNTTAIENDDGEFGGATVTISASTFWANTTHLVHTLTGFLPPMIYSGTKVPPSSSSAVADPMYVSATDLHLRPGSPCVDSGLPTGAPDHDLDQGGRPSGGAFDRGAFELSASGVMGAGGANGAGGSGISIGGGEAAGGDAGCACGVGRHAGARDGVVFGGLLLLPLARRLRRARPRA